MERPEQLLILAQMAQVTRKSPSRILSLDDELTAFQFDAACTYALVEFENKRDFARLRSLVKSIAVLLVSLLGGDTSSLLEDDDPEQPADAMSDADFFEKMGSSELSV